jgi:hypothetical protein
MGLGGGWWLACQIGLLGHRSSFWRMGSASLRNYWWDCGGIRGREGRRSYWRNGWQETLRAEFDSMTDWEFWTAIGVFLSIFLNMGSMIFFCRQRLEKLEACLQGVKCVEWNRDVCGNGYFGRQLRLHTIANIVFMPGLLYKRAEIPKGADKRIPEGLRKQLRALYIHLYLNGLAFTVLYFVLVGRSTG